MILDLIILAILGLTVFLSMRKGFIMSIVSFAKGFVSLIIAWLLCGKVSGWLMNETEAGVVAAERISSELSSKWETSQLYQALPDLFKEGDMSNLSATLISDGAVKIAGVLLTILCFVVILVLLRLVLSVASRLFSHKHNGGFTGAMDWFLGGALGLILGVIYVFVFLALLVPFVGIIMPQHCETVLSWLDSSYVAGDLYNNNLLLVFFRDFLA